MDVKTKTKNPVPEVMTVEELAHFRRVGRTNAFPLLRDGQVRSIRIGRLRRIRRQDAEEFLERLAAGEADHD